MLSSFFPPIKGQSDIVSLSHHRTENNSHRLPSITEIDDYADEDGGVLINIPMKARSKSSFEKLISLSLYATAALYSIGERTLKRYQSQIATNLGLSQNSARIIRDQF